MGSAERRRRRRENEKRAQDQAKALATAAAATAPKQGWLEKTWGRFDLVSGAWVAGLAALPTLVAIVDAVRGGKSLIELVLCVALVVAICSFLVASWKVWMTSHSSDDSTRMKKWMSGALRGVVMIFFAILYFYPWNGPQPPAKAAIVPQRGRPFATPEELKEVGISKKTIWLNDIAFGDTGIRDRVFNECDIYGPAVLDADGCTWTDCYFPATAEDLFWIETTRTRGRPGALMVDGCVFRKCNFFNVSILATEAQVERYLQSSPGLRPRKSN